MSGVELEFRELSVYDVGALGERFDIVLFMGVLYHLRHPLLALDLIHEHVARDCWCSSRCSAAAPRSSRWRGTTPFTEVEVFDRPGYPEAAFHRAPLRRRSDQLVGAEPRLLEAMLRSAGFAIIAPPGGGGVHLPPRRSCPAGRVRSIQQRGEER